MTAGMKWLETTTPDQYAIVCARCNKTYSKHYGFEDADLVVCRAPSVIGETYETMPRFVAVRHIDCPFCGDPTRVFTPYTSGAATIISTCDSCDEVLTDSHGRTLKGDDE